ncbi:MAG: SDR family oxidoreductase [Nitrospiraceae bacterium]|nr:SDR family oxidoreductase [Nitrospiraceae bacterium]
MPASKYRAVLITGASTGIGAACAIHLDRLGFVVLAGVRRDEDEEALRRAASPSLVPLRLDVTDPASIALAREAVDAIVGEAGLAGLINNAGIVVAGPVEAVPISAWRRQLEVNVVGAVAVTQAFLPLLRTGGGRIINMGSIAGRATMPMMGPYSASKHALEAITDALRLELQPWNLHVCIVEPGAIATPIWDKSMKDAMALESSADPQLLGRYAGGVAAVKRAVAKAAARAISPDAVVTAVVHALTVARPKTRYLVGRDALVRALMAKMLPDRAVDRLLTWVLGLPR